MVDVVVVVVVVVVDLVARVDATVGGACAVGGRGRGNSEGGSPCLLAAMEGRRESRTGWLGGVGRDDGGE